MITDIIALISGGVGFARIIAFILAYILAIVIAFSLHEFAHAFCAYKLGDPTPKAMGRLTLNPLRHIDGYGLIGFFLVGFGWAKPVPVNPLHFKNYRRGLFLVSIAGVLTNLILAFVFSGIFVFFFVSCAKYNAPAGNFNINTLINIVNSGAYAYANEFLYFIHFLLTYSTVLNIALLCFNLIPIFPLDGFNALRALFRFNPKFLNFMYRWGNLILVILILTPFFGTFYGMATGFIESGLFKFWGLFI